MKTQAVVEKKMRSDFRTNGTQTAIVPCSQTALFAPVSFLREL